MGSDTSGLGKLHISIWILHSILESISIIKYKYTYALELELKSELESESESKYDSELDDELGMRIENELRIHLAKDLPRAGKFINPKVLLKIVKNYFSCKTRHRQG